MESKQLHSIIGIWTNACRFLLAAVFIFSGFVKAVDPLGTQYKIQDYLEVFGWAASVPAFLPFLASVLQAMVEFCLGVYLLFGIRRRMTTLFVVLIMGVMTPLTLWLALSNPISDCGCFGDAVTLTNWETFGKNVLLLIAAEIKDRQLTVAIQSHPRNIEKRIHSPQPIETLGHQRSYTVSPFKNGHLLYQQKYILPKSFRFCQSGRSAGYSI